MTEYSIGAATRANDPCAYNVQGVTITAEEREALLDAYVAQQLEIQRKWGNRETAEEIRANLEFPHGNPAKPKWDDETLLREMVQYGLEVLLKFMDERGTPLLPA
jgi:hypothetical protein